MKAVAKFEKVSFEQFKKDYEECFIWPCTDVDEKLKTDIIKAHYDKIKLPKRATTGSAGYDFYLPNNVFIGAGKTVKIPTGIRCKIDDGYVLELYPRSGLGFKFRMQLNNTVGIIDSDYYNANNEGHIMAKITNDTNEEKFIDLKEGDGFMQGIFKEYFVTYDDETEGVRVGGFGSTSK